MALIDGSARMAAVQTTRPSTLASLPRAAFTSLLNDNDPGATLLLRNMAAVLCQRLREMTYILQDVVDDPGPRIQVAPETIRDVIKAVLLQN